MRQLQTLWSLKTLAGQGLKLKVSRYRVSHQQLKMAPYGLLPSVSFESQIQFSASQNLCLARSKYLKLPKSERRGGGSIKLPDFSLRLYRSLSVPQRKERKPCAIVAAPITNGTNRTAGVILPNVLHESYKRKDPPKFITSHRPPGVLESELMFVKMEKFPSEPYKNPKLHNFRPVSVCQPKVCFLSYMFVMGTLYTT